MGYVKKNLMEKRRVIYETRGHIIYFLSPLFLFYYGLSLTI